MTDPPERALLAQSTAHYSTLETHYQLGKGALLREGAVFGENLCVKGLNADIVNIGDVFQVIHEGQVTSTRLQVSSPRLPCAKVNGSCKRWVKSSTHKKADGWEQMKVFCSRTGLGGWFFRVLAEGPISVGDKLERTEQVLPTWNLNRLAAHA